MKYRAIIFLICYLVLLVQPVMPMVQYQLGGGCVSDFFDKTYAVSLPCVCAVTAQQNRSVTASALQASEASYNKARLAPLSSLLPGTINPVINTGQEQQDNIKIHDLLNLDAHAVFIPLVISPQINRFEAARVLPDFLTHKCIMVPVCPPGVPPQRLVQIDTGVVSAG